MKRNIKLVELLPWTELLDVHLKKDPGLFPLYISKYYKIPFEIVYIKGNKNSIKNTTFSPSGNIVGLKPIIRHRITKLADLRRLIFLLPLIIYVIKTRKTTSHYLLFHGTDNSLTLVYFIKLFNPNAKIWLKLDANLEGLKELLFLMNKNENIKQKLLSWRYKKLFSKIDLISTETKCTYDILKNDSYMKKLNIQIISNGLEKNNIVKRYYKENLIISVARFGTYQKNTELLLKALSRVDLKNWKVFLIGPVEKEEQNFNIYLELFFDKHQDLKEKIIFTGNIDDSKLLNEFYQKAKVFILPSRFESFGIATLEALSNGDYAILTDVGAARDLITNEDFGYILPNSEQNHQNENEIENNIIKKLQEIINNDFDIEKTVTNRINYFNNFSMDHIIQSIVFKEWIKI